MNEIERRGDVTEIESIESVGGVCVWMTCRVHRLDV